MGIVNKIHESYEVIFDLKKEFNSNVIKEVADVYDNVDFENIGHGNPINDTINLSLLTDVQNAAKAAGVKVSITTAKSGHNEKTKSGNESRHTPGNAVDIAKINGKAVSPSNSTDANKFVDELIKMGYTKNSETSANPKSVLTFGFEGHDNHVHVSNTTNSPSSSNNSTQSTDNTSTTSTSTGNNPILRDIITGLTSSIGLSEEKIYGKFGDKVSSRYGVYIIPKDDNTKIKSPVSGVVTTKGYNPSCNNQIIIMHEIDNKTYYLEYCGISKPSVKKGDNVKKGTLLGKTDSDVTVTLYDSNKNKESIDSHKDKEIGNTKTNEKKTSQTKGYESGVLSKIIQAPFKMFQDVKDDEGNVIEKRWGSPTEKEQPVDWIKRKSPTYSKKLKEDINRIKGLLK